MNKTPYWPQHWARKYTYYTVINTEQTDTWLGVGHSNYSVASFEVY